MLSRIGQRRGAGGRLAQPADKLDEHVEYQHVEEHLRPGRSAVLHEPAEQLPLQPPAAQRVEFLAVLRPQEEREGEQGRRPRPGHGRPAGPGDAQLGKAGPAEDQDQRQRHVHRGPRGLDSQHGPGLAAAGKEPIDRGHDQHRQRGEAQASQVDDLERLQGRGVPADRDQVGATPGP